MAQEPSAAVNTQGGALRGPIKPLRAGRYAQTAALHAEVAALRRELDGTTGMVVALHRGLGMPDSGQADLAAIVGATEDAIYSMTADTTVLTWNVGAEHMLGYSADQMIGSSARSLVPDDQLPGFEAGLDRIREGEHALSYDAWRLRRDGSPIEVSVSLAGMLEPDGSLAGFCAVMRDLSARREAEAAIAAIEVERQVHEDRERIAQSLNDLVIRRIFAAGLAVEAAAQLVDADVGRRLAQVVEDLDLTITELRSAILGLRPRPLGEEGPCPREGRQLRMRLQPIDAVTLFVNDLSKVKAFYGGVFGLPVVFEDDNLAVLQFDNDILLNLLDVAAAPGLLPPAADGGRGDGARSRFTIHVDDFDAVCQELAHRGVAMLNGPPDRLSGLSTASFLDPSGHIWEVAQSIS